eukprot:19161-Heterococcus_DN1.PRE.2
MQHKHAVWAYAAALARCSVLALHSDNLSEKNTQTCRNFSTRNLLRHSCSVQHSTHRNILSNLKYCLLVDSKHKGKMCQGSGMEWHVHYKRRAEDL